MRNQKDVCEGGEGCGTCGVHCLFCGRRRGRSISRSEFMSSEVPLSSLELSESTVITDGGRDSLSSSPSGESSDIWSFPGLPEHTSVAELFDLCDRRARFRGEDASGLPVSGALREVNFCALRGIPWQYLQERGPAWRYLQSGDSGGGVMIAQASSWMDSGGMSEADRKERSESDGGRQVLRLEEDAVGGEAGEADFVWASTKAKSMKSRGIAALSQLSKDATIAACAWLIDRRWSVPSSDAVQAATEEKSVMKSSRIRLAWSTSL